MVDVMWQSVLHLCTIISLSLIVGDVLLCSIPSLLVVLFDYRTGSGLCLSLPNNLCNLEVKSCIICSDLYLYLLRIPISCC